MSSATQLTVCTRCRPRRSERGGTGGQLLFDTLAAQTRWLRRESIQLVDWDCLGACDHACAVSLRAPGKFVLVLGGLSEAMVSPLIELGTAYAQSATGYLARPERPAALRSAVLVQVPPVGTP